MQRQIESAVLELIKALGEDESREGLKETPRRVAKSYKELFSGYSRSLEEEITIFKNEHGFSGVIYSGRINFFSFCEHHLLPFFGEAHIAYVPGKKIVGLSKLSRAMDIYSRRLQDQERITHQVLSELEKLLKPKGMAIMVESQHLCNMARGVKDVNSSMKTLQFSGLFSEDNNLQKQFFNLARNS